MTARERILGAHDLDHNFGPHDSADMPKDKTVVLEHHRRPDGQSVKAPPAPLSMTKEKDQSGNMPMARPRAEAKISIPKESLR